MSEMPLFPQESVMDPNLFALNWDVVFEVVVTIVLLAFILERALAVLFESRWFKQIEKGRETKDKGTFKPLIAFVVAAAGCVLWEFDALSIILLRDKVTILGAVITGAVVAGGSKGALTLFRNILKVREEAASAKPAEGDKSDKEGKPA